MKTESSFFIRVLAVSICLAALGSSVWAGGNSETGSRSGDAETVDGTASEPVFEEPDTDYFPEKINLKHADGFTVEYHNNYKIVTVLRPWPGSDLQYKFLLVQKDTPVPPGYNDALIVEIPIDSMVSMSTSFISALEMLGRGQSLVGVDNADYIYNPNVRKRIESFQVLEIARDFKPNIELLIEMEPSIIMASGTGSEFDIYPKMMEAGLPVVLNGEWTEGTPLSRAEWIKFIALFYNDEGKANKIFSTIETQYTALIELTDAVGEKPTIFSGAPFQGTWGVPGGKSYMANLFEDAGADYLWKEDQSTGSQQLAFESVFFKAENADIWINAGWNWHSLQDALKEDERFSKFHAFETGSVYSREKRISDTGGNDYWESGILNPHVILADMIKILHPDLLPNHELYYYFRIP
jgi:iron complex transport system substrate-binding protein